MAFTLLIIYTILLYVRPQEWGNAAPSGNDTFGLIAISLSTCLIFFIFQRRKNLHIPQVPLMALLSIWILLSFSLATGWQGGAVTQGLQFIQAAFIPFLLINGIINTQRRQLILMGLLTCAALFMVLNGFYQIQGGAGLGLAGNTATQQGEDLLRIRYLGLFSDPNDLGMLLVMVLPFVFALKSRVPPVFRLPFWLASLALLYGIYLTNSRGTLVSLLGLTVFATWKLFGTLRSGMLAVALSPLALFFVSNTREFSVDESAEGRLDAWYAATQLFFENPLFGVGQGMFTEYHVRTAHNSFALAISEMGFVGSFLWVAVIVATFQGLSKISGQPGLQLIKERAPDRLVAYSQESQISAALLFSLVAYVISSVFLSRTYQPLLYYFLAMAGATIGRTLDAYPEIGSIFDVRSIVKWSAAITVMGVFFLIFAVRFFT